MIEAGVISYFHPEDVSYKRQGSCNLCGECCGYPRSTDEGQNNAWPNDWPEGIADWRTEEIERSAPILQAVDRHKRSGIIKIRRQLLYWIWVQGHGLCTDKPPYGNSLSYDQRCPFLSEKLQDGTVPCLLFNTKLNFIWKDYCSVVPPERFDTQEQVDAWFKNCPSCSFQYIRG